MCVRSSTQFIQKWKTRGCWKGRIGGAVTYLPSHLTGGEGYTFFHPKLLPKCLAMLFKIQSTSAFNVGVEPKMVWRTLDYEMAEAAQSLGWAELDEVGPGTGDKDVQKRLLEANWCFFRFCVWHQHFVPKLRVLLQSVHGTSNLLRDSAFNQPNSGCSSHQLLNIHSPIVVAASTVKVFPELAKCNKFRPGCWQNATYVPDKDIDPKIIGLGFINRSQSKWLQRNNNSHRNS